MKTASTYQEEQRVNLERNLGMGTFTFLRCQMNDAIEALLNPNQRGNTVTKRDIAVAATEEFKQYLSTFQP